MGLLTVRLLLDSHVLLWWDNDLNRLSAAQLRAISDPENVIFVSATTAWELGIKVATGKLKISDSIKAMAERYELVEILYWCDSSQKHTLRECPRSD